MHEINLIDFAIDSEKIHPDLLVPKEPRAEEITNFKITLAYAFDLAVIIGLSSMVISLYAASISPLMTKTLARAFSQQDLGPYAYLSFPFVMITYFFCSFLLNDGQTWGLALFKTRIHMRRVDFIHSFRWTAFSVAACFTCGLSMFFSSVMEDCGFGSYKAQDHFYLDLMTHREYFRANLDSQDTPGLEIHKVPDYQQAA